VNRGDIDNAFATLGAPFFVLAESSITSQPGKGAFDYPTARQNLKADLVRRTRNDLRPQTFVTKLQEWAFRIGRNYLPAVSSKEFAYDHLSRLGLHEMAESLAYKRSSCSLRLQAA
jgi:hypothetical protein